MLCSQGQSLGKNQDCCKVHSNVLKMAKCMQPIDKESSSILTRRNTSLSAHPTFALPCNFAGLSMHHWRLQQQRRSGFGCNTHNLIRLPCLNTALRHFPKETAQSWGLFGNDQWCPGAGGRPLAAIFSEFYGWRFEWLLGRSVAPCFGFSWGSVDDTDGQIPT